MRLGGGGDGVGGTGECIACTASISDTSCQFLIELTTGDGGEECENRDRGSSLDPGERLPSPSEGRTTSDESRMCRRSRRIRRRS